MVAVLIQTGPDLTRTNFLKAAETICKWGNGAVIAPRSLSPTDHNWNSEPRYGRKADRRPPAW